MLDHPAHPVQLTAPRDLPTVITPVLLSSPALRPWLTTLQGHHMDNTKTSVATVDSRYIHSAGMPVPRYKPDEYLHSTVHGARLLP